MNRRAAGSLVTTWTLALLLGFGSPAGLWASQSLLDDLARARSAAAETPNDVARQLEVARVLARLEATDDALATLDAVHRQAPTLAEAYLLAAVLLRDAGRDDEAVTRLDQALAAGVDDPAVREQLGFLRLTAGDVAGALAVGDAVLASHDQRGDAWLLVGLARAAEPARRDEAVPALERALLLGTAQPSRAHLELGALLVEQGRAGDAVGHLESAAEGLPNDPERYYRLGNALRAVGDREGARAALEQFQTLRRAADAADHGAKALGASLNEAQTLALENRLPEALAQVRTLLEDHPEAAGILALEGKIAFSMGEREAALASLSRAAANEPGQPEYHFLEGQFSVALGRLAQAQAALERAVALDAELKEGHRLLGLVQAQQGDFAAAETSLHQAIALGAEGADTRRALAEVLKRLGKTAEAEAQMTVYRQLSGG